jgi:branched-chain amino acid aminotransferase
VFESDNRTRTLGSLRNDPEVSDHLAGEVFICGTMFELQPVVSMDNIKVGDGEVGEVTGKIRSYYLDVVSGKVPKHNDWLTSV